MEQTSKLATRCRELREQRDAYLKQLLVLEEEQRAAMGIQKLHVLIKQECRKAITVSDGDMIKAADMLGIGKTTLYRWVREWAATELAEVKAS
jgi:transcriptional regulator of acetoin/glycerol metabolism